MQGYTTRFDQALAITLEFSRDNVIEIPMKLNLIVKFDSIIMLCIEYAHYRRQKRRLVIIELQCHLPSHPRY